MTRPVPPPGVAAVYRAVLDCTRCHGAAHGCGYVVALSWATYSAVLREVDEDPDLHPPAGVQLLAHEVVVDDTLEAGVVLTRPRVVP